MISKIKNYLIDLRGRQQMAIALTKGSIKLRNRRIDLSDPDTWEFSAFSQNGEDGILDVLRTHLLSHNRYVIEIGSSDGIQNNSSWLIVAEQYDGLLIDGDLKLVERARRMLCGHSIGIKCLDMFVNKYNIQDLKMLASYSNPDVFSLDIDGIDYYIARLVMDSGFRPKIFVVEYNSAFGPERSQTITYRDGFVFTRAHPTHLYYGVSIAAWQKFFAGYGYHFVTVDRKGVNAFFVDPCCFEMEFLGRINGTKFRENIHQRQKFRGTFENQFRVIADLDFLDV
jgi:hypothetical protein